MKTIALLTCDEIESSFDEILGVGLESMALPITHEKGHRFQSHDKMPFCRGEQGSLDRMQDSFDRIQASFIGIYGSFHRR